MATVIVRHRVQDFSTWKQAFEAHAGARSAAGFTKSRVFQTADDPNQIVIEFETKDLNAAKAFAESQDLKGVMKQAGVLGQPDMYFLNDGQTYSC